MHPFVFFGLVATCGFLVTVITFFMSNGEK